VKLLIKNFLSKFKSPPILIFDNYDQPIIDVLANDDILFPALNYFDSIYCKELVELTKKTFLFGRIRFDSDYSYFNTNVDWAYEPPLTLDSNQMQTYLNQ